MLLAVSVYLIPFFDLTAIPLSLLFISLFGALVVLVLVFLSGLSRTAYMVVFLALRVLYVVVLCLFRFCLSSVFSFSLLNFFLAAMSFADYFHACFLLPTFFPVRLFCFVFLRPSSPPVCFGATSSIIL